jgi:hypothetical protein
VILFKEGEKDMKLFLIFVLLFSFSGFVLADENQSTAKTCCFSNSQFTGVCEVTPAKDETCDSILKYLNTAGTVGKTYCNNSRIRGGWKKANCEDKEKQQNKVQRKLTSRN